MSTHPVLAASWLIIKVLRELLDAVWARCGIGIGRPERASKAVAARLKSGMWIAQAYLRRLLLVLALELEPTLVDTRQPLTGPRRARRTRSSSSYRFRVLEDRIPALTEAAQETIRQTQLERRRLRPARSVFDERQPVPMARLYRRFDWLSAVAANPLPKAMRLALHLARSRPHVILPPDRGLRIPGRWGTEPSMLFGFMGQHILERSRERPPPQPPLQRRWPSIRIIDW